MLQGLGGDVSVCEIFFKYLAHEPSVLATFDLSLNRLAIDRLFPIERRKAGFWMSCLDQSDAAEFPSNTEAPDPDVWACCFVCSTPIVDTPTSSSRRLHAALPLDGRDGGGYHGHCRRHTSPPPAGGAPPPRASADARRRLTHAVGSDDSERMGGGARRAAGRGARHSWAWQRRRRCRQRRGAMQCSPRRVFALTPRGGRGVQRR